MKLSMHRVPRFSTLVLVLMGVSVFQGHAGVSATGAVMEVQQAVRTLAGHTVSIALHPGLETQAHAVEETLPPGLMPTEISHDGAWDAAARVIRWGLFLDNDARTLSYRVAGAPGFYDFSGVASYDGVDAAITGAGTLEIIAGDFDGDGNVNLTDLLIMLDGWGEAYGLPELLGLLDNWGRTSG